MSFIKRSDAAPLCYSKPLDSVKRNFALEGENDLLSERVTTLESVTALKETEVISLESERGGLVNQAIGCAINKGIQDGLKAGVDHGKAGRDLSMIEVYDPSAESKYIDVVNALGAVDFSLLIQLESKKDASMVDLIDSLCLEGPLDEIPRAEDLQPSLEQLMFPIHRTEDKVLLRETSISFSLQVVRSRVQKVRGEIKEKRLSLTDVMVPLVEPLYSKSLINEASTFAAPATADPITTLSITFAPSGVVPPLFVPDYQVLDTELHDGDPSSTA
ncbi:hypothetical protein Tco_1230292 [Tanacetum coccineum]